MNMGDIDEYHIWQQRIHQGIRYQKGAVPFPESVKIGLEFNAALERKETLDPSLLTNAVMLELCQFAKTVTKSEKYFLFEMLEYNFDLGVDVANDLQCYEYAACVHNKIKLLKEQIKSKPHKWNEAFLLPDVNSMMAFLESVGPGRYHPKKNKVVDSSLLTDVGKNCHFSETLKAGSNGVATSMFIMKKRGGVWLKLTDSLYPFCSKLGVTLAVQPNETAKQKLDPSLVTNGVMMELLDFSRVLCGTETRIVNSLVKKNFGHEFDRLQFRVQYNKLAERKYACLSTAARDAFRKETFKVQIGKREQSSRKRKNPGTDDQELAKITIVSKRRKTLRHRGSDTQDTLQDSNLSYICPVDFETETQSGTAVRPEQIKPENLSGVAAETQLAESVDVKQEEEEVFISPAQPQTNGHSSDMSHFHLKDQSLKALSNLFSEDKNEDINVRTPKQRLWIRRANRSKQILKSSRVNDLFAHSRAIGLDFNVGSGNKQNLDLQLFTNWMLLEVFKFATGMTKSLGRFLSEILISNFSLVLVDELHQRNFIFYFITKEKNIQNHPDRQKREFLNSQFKCPEVYNMVDVTSNFQSEKEVETVQQIDCDSSTLTANWQTEEEPYPFCKRIGLNLWSTEERPASQKLALSVLTTGAVLEIFSFVRELCGSVPDTVNDVLEHNFDLELRSGATKAAQVIQRWYLIQKSLMKKQSMTPKIYRWLNRVVPLNGHSPSPAGSGVQGLDSGDVKPSTARRARSRNVCQVEKANSYHFCKEIGLKLDVGLKSEAKPKLDLQVLTRGVLFEMHRYVEQHSNRYVPTLYEILEYNFDLSSQSHRKVEFAWSIASQVIAMVRKNGRTEDYLTRVFELPMEVSESSQTVCKEEPEDGFGKLGFNDDDIMFVRKLKPVDIEVEIE
uniref:uncharacterized protein LOC109968714 n=1 Tax=Monopterus albus TaxID=43700 RepID=UPI0009B41BD1|nr:uncharacterized protein LOC109968714 [Monopterus albus]